MVHTRRARRCTPSADQAQGWSTPKLGRCNHQAEADYSLYYLLSHEFARCVLMRLNERSRALRKLLEGKSRGHEQQGMVVPEAG